MLRTLLAALALVLALVPLSLRADGFIYIPEYPDVIRPPRVVHPAVRPHFPLSITRHRVHAEIAEGLVKTSVEETFYNSSARQLEGFYMFPLPDGAVASGFVMKIGGKEVKGEILEKDRSEEHTSELQSQ